MRGGQPFLDRGGELKIQQGDRVMREGEQESRGCRVCGPMSCWMVGTWDRDRREKQEMRGHLDSPSRWELEEETPGYKVWSSKACHSWEAL